MDYRLSHSWRAAHYRLVSLAMIPRECELLSIASLSHSGCNFGLEIGAAPQDLQVYVGDSLCSNPEIVTRHFAVRCVLPAGAGYNVSVTVRRGTQQGSARLLSYRGRCMILAPWTVLTVLFQARFWRRVRWH